MINIMHDVKDISCKELQEIVEEVKKSGAMNMGNLEAMHKLTDTVKNACKIEAMCSGQGGYSRDGEWSARGMYGRSYDGGSYGDGGYSGRRDARGRYSRDEGPGYSRDMGYSRSEGREQAMRDLEKMMNASSSHEEKQVLREVMDKLKQIG